MFRRGKKDDGEDEIDSLRGDFTGDDELIEEDEDAMGFLNDVVPSSARNDEGDDDDDDDGGGRRRRRRSPRAAGSVGLIGGFLRVIGIALLSLLIFLLIGFGLAFGAGAINAITLIDVSAISLPTIEFPVLAATAVPLVESQPTVEISGLPTPFPSPTRENVVVIVPTPVICREMETFWEDQAAVYESFIAMSVETPPETVLALLQQQRIKRDSTRNTVLPPCVDGVRTALVAGYDNMITAFETLSEGGNLQGARSFALIAGQAFSDALVGLWTAGVTMPDSPLAEEILVGSGASCGASTWYQAAQTQRNTLINAYLSVDPVNTPRNLIRPYQNTMATARENVAALDAPTCAATPSRLLLALMDDLINAMGMRLGDNPAEAERQDSARQNQIQLDAWLQYLGLAP